jgi:glycosyltransferase involved in cell wall biosynthesis
MKAALLTNFIPPYRKSLFTNLSARLDQLTILVSVHMEGNRTWKPDYEGLNVVKQRTISYSKKWEHEAGFQETTEVHIPFDTIFKLAKAKPDVVISGELGFRSLLASLYCMIYGKPLILWLTLSDHTEQNKVGLRLVLRKFLLKQAAVLLCNGAACERYVKQLGIHKPMFFAPYTSDFQIQNPKTSFNYRRKILFTGQLISRKGVKQMTAALKTWSVNNPEKELELLVAGDGHEKSSFEILANCPNIKLKLLGSVAYADLANLYCDADIYIFPTLADEWGVVVNEALSSGLPVLGSIYSQAVEELVKNDVNGWLFKPDDQTGFATAISQALNADNRTLAHFSKNSVEAIQALTAENIANEMIKAIKASLRKN